MSVRHFLQIFLFWVVGGPLLTAVSGESIRIATYNVENYLVMDRYHDGSWRPAYPKPEIEKTAVRSVIATARPDVLALQEIGDSRFLEELRADLELEGLNYTHAIHMQGDDAVRHLAVLSKLPPVEVVRHRDLDFRYFDDRVLVKRGLLEVSFARADGSAFKLFVVHLKSRWTDDERDPQSALRRVREAEACRNRIIERTLDSGLIDFVIAGDFNDHPDSGTLRRFQQRGRLNIGSRLPAGDSRGHTWTHFFERQGSYTTVDGFVLSENVLPRAVGGRGTIVDLQEALQGSDHRLVYFDLEE